MIASLMSEIKGQLHLKRFEYYHSGAENKIYFDYGNYERYEKTFLDFMVMANSEKIFLLKGNNMRESGYSFAASKIYNREFAIIEY